MTLDDVLRELIRNVVREECRLAVEELRVELHARPPTTAKAYLTTAEAAARAGVTAATIRA